MLKNRKDHVVQQQPFTSTNLLPLLVHNETTTSKRDAVRVSSYSWKGGFLEVSFNVRAETYKSYLATRSLHRWN